MRRSASFPLVLTALGLAGCSGLGHFAGDTFSLPGANPNKPYGASENMLRVQDRPSTTAPIEPESGNVWPGPPRPFPTLSQVEHETQNGQVAVPSGGPAAGAGGGGGGGAGGSGGSAGGGHFQMQSNPNAASTITIPNGNGTSTVIAPDGSVKVIPTPKTGP